MDRPSMHRPSIRRRSHRHTEPAPPGGRRFAMSAMSAVMALSVVAAGPIGTGVAVADAPAGGARASTPAPPAIVGSDVPGAAAGAAPAAANAARTVSGSRGAIVITVTLAETAQLPRIEPDKTAAQVNNSVFDASRPWFSDVSNGVFSGYFALRRGPYTVTTTAPPCSVEWLHEISDQANEAVLRREPNLDPATSAAAVYYFGNVSVCTNSGWGDTPDLGNRVWLNGDSTLRTAVHEFGHNMGLRHSGSAKCVDARGSQVPFSTNCPTVNEYGDAFSAMSSVAPVADGYTPSQLAQLGWNDGRVATVTPLDGTKHFVLTKAEDNVPGSTQAVVVFDGNTTLWLEYRLPDTSVNYGSIHFVEGLLVRQEVQTVANSDFLLFMNREDISGGFTTEHPAMRVGQTWANPLGNLQITLDFADADTATVTVSSSLQTATVPNVVRLPTASADVTIRNSGLVVGAVDTKVDFLCERLGEVLSQSPSPGTVLPAGSPVNYTFAVEPIKGCPADPP